MIYYRKTLFGCGPKLTAVQHIKIIKNGSNLGFATACNIGARAANGSYFLFLNPDCVLAADVMQRMLDAADLMMDVGMVGGLLVYPDGTEQGGGR